MPSNGVQTNPDNASASTTSNPIHRHIDDFLVCPGLGGDVGESELPCLTTLFAEITLMASSTFAVTDNAFSHGTRGTAHGDGSHRSTSKIPSYTKSINWSHYPIFGNLINVSTSTQFIGGVKIVLVVSCILLIFGAIFSKISLIPFTKIRNSIVALPEIEPH